ncbi:AAA family ATPase [Hwanghaeella sp.]|uniref:AAA family ATPase n=1 Tax=Hwanghaeella sp. TaxID=2605943 RepID=UPI003CCBD91D
MHFSKLKLSGFKSFVDPAELVIDGGITGVVGPNGCGKSNVIEALRWVMGETSAKRMRGSEMDDVIFGGSSQRPARNIAEVSLLLDNSMKDAPAPYDTLEELEITRRIERGAGSNYRINGKEVRARDVQLLFADMATGANSTAIVSQGRIGAIIGAKPTERRTLLEEAAGIRGLHSRRHEAELRLKAAESNLERLDDVIGALETQHQGLQRQARQTNRYRRLSDHIRRHEAILLHLRWQDAKRAMDIARQRLNEAEALVHEKAQNAATAARDQADAATALPTLRQADAEAAAGLQHLQLAVRELENEQERILAARDALAQRLAQIAADRAREDSLFNDAKQAVERLTAEATTIEEARAAEGETLEQARVEADAAAKAVEEKEAELSELTEQAAGVEAQRNALQRQLAESGQRVTVLENRLRGLDEQEAKLKQETESLAEIETAEARVAECEAAVSAARDAATAAEAALAECREKETAARSALQESERLARDHLAEVQSDARETVETAERAAREAVDALEQQYRALDAEIRALAALVDTQDDALDPAFRPLIDSLSVQQGYEAALGAAFGEELDASTDGKAQIHWTELPPLSAAPGFPAGVEPLSNFVDGPKALARRLSFIGVVPDGADGDALQSELAAGQRLVSRDGGLWRWDGYSMAAGAPTAAAKRLEQRNRLAEIREEFAKVEKDLTEEREAADERLEEARAKAEAKVQEATRSTEANLAELRIQAQAAEAEASEKAASQKTASQALQDAFSALNRAQQAQSALAGKAADLRSRLQGISENRERLQADASEARDQIESAQKAMDVLEDPLAARERINALRATVAELRSTLIDKRGAVERFQRESQARTARLEAIAQEQASWQQRMTGADGRMKSLADRAQQAEEENAALESRPAEIQAQHHALNDKIVVAEAKRNTAADALSEGEKKQQESDKALREAEAALATAREDRVRRESEVEQADQAAQTIRERIAETLDCAPDAVLKAGGVEPDEELPPRDDIERKLERLTRERENMGAVNLRAEQEATELEEQITSMHTEREDLLAAISRLRQGINALNREGRERLLAAFEQVNAHFKDLFVRLFGGGEAHLTLTEADDPLEAGLEIMASPPGKRMQIMSLLSGGEQALTALSLLFGVFLVNPAPICVLDEVDAPLDDSNVDRFCTLLDEIAHTGKTRFLVVTHHRMTMARMDRLFGVTMAERGISQLVSVDLREAARMRDSA